jgi:hypothetical protein
MNQMDGTEMGKSNPLLNLKIPIGLFLYNEGLNRPEYLGTNLPLYINVHSMIKKDDYSGNINFPYKIEGGSPSPLITININGLLIQSIATDCR